MLEPTAIIGLVGCLITIPAWIFFLRGAWIMYSTLSLIHI